MYQAFLNQNVGPSDLVERIAYNLNIASYKTKSEIKIFADYLHDNFLRCSPPRSSVAISIVEKVTNSQPAVEIVARNCDISLSCLRRLRRVYKEEIAAVHQAIANKPFWLKGETDHESEQEAGGSTRPRFQP